MEQLFSAIPAVLKNLEPNPEADKAIVFAAWKRCAGELLRTRTTPLDFAENRLVIAVADKTWQRHLEDLKPADARQTQRLSWPGHGQIYRISRWKV